MSKVPNCKGSYQKRKSGTGYQVKYPLGWSDEKKKYDEYREDVPSEAEAIVLIKELNAFEFHGGKAADIPAYRSKEVKETETKAVTFREFAEHYCAVREQQKAVKPKSIKSDRECINRVLPYIGDKPVQDIASKDIDEMYAAMRSGKKSRAGGIKYSGTTLERTHAVISAKGGHILQSNFDRWFNKARLRYPVPDDFKFHELRHTYVTFVNRECEIDEKTTRALSGHKTLEAFQIYTHTNTEWMREAAKRLGALISPVPPRSRCRYCALWTASPLNAEEGCCWSTERSQLVITSRKQGCDIDCFTAA